MNIEKKFTHSTVKNDYNVMVEVGERLKIKLEEKFSLAYWEGEFSMEQVKEITFKTGNELFFQEFVNILVKAFEQKDISCYVDILTSQDLQNLKAKRTNQPQSTTTTKQSSSKSNKRYIILTYMANDTKYHYPLSLQMKEQEQDMDNLKQVYKELRVELESMRTAVLNQTQNKTQNSFSIEYDKKGKGKDSSSKTKQVDQVRSQNQMLKAKLARLEEQAVKKKANIEIEAAIERTKQLKEKLETQNLQLVDWKNKISDEEAKQLQLKKQMEELHKKICKLLTSEKQVTVKKKGQDTEKELKLVKNAIKKNNTEIQKLKKQLQDSKARVKQLQQKAKKLTSEKNVIQRGQRRGPYSSAGSVRSFGSYNSYGSKRSGGSNNSLSSGKPRSNYSYNSNRFR